MAEPTDNLPPFSSRHLGPGQQHQNEMLATLEVGSLSELIDQVIPDPIRGPELNLPPGLAEPAALARLKTLADQNQVFRSFIGQGYYNCHLPTVILRNVLENPAWYTAYTPYQPEISQGRLEALLNFQTMVTELTGMDVANASLLDEGTAAAEAMTLCHRVSKSGSSVFLVSEQCHPQTIEVLKTRAAPLDISLKIGALGPLLDSEDCFGALEQYPGTLGTIPELAPLAEKCHQKKALFAVAADPLALTLLKTPGECGADVVVGNTQRFGIPLGFGGPHAAFFATRDAYKRDIPGRLVGVSIDRLGNPAYRLALQTREQHIRREKATSNICTAQALLAIMASFYACYHGPEGLKQIAQEVNRHTRILRLGLEQLGYQLPDSPCFDTLTIGQVDAHHLRSLAQAKQINLRALDNATVGIALDETVTPSELQLLLDIFAEAVRQTAPTVQALDSMIERQEGLPISLLRADACLKHPVFSRHHSETQMLRYLRQLADRDLALDRTMIPLGSCTMKLNATSEMLPITWPQFSDIHPFAPAEQTRGYQALITELEQMLCACTGYDAVSLQPNAGSQGEYAGLLAIRAWHESRGQPQRNICLIPQSAHGTNPASAHMAGFEVVVVKCDSRGNVDLDDLKEKAEQHSAQLAAIMITYPSTHGVFEAAVEEICAVVHQQGGQVYIDGANLNAMVGLCAPGQFGGDVSHLNLHKTFCIPHGGGGPGVGPTCVKSHLAPFLPGHQTSKLKGMGAVASAAWGSAGILPITWMYITLMGAAGLKRATEVAILNANYIATRLAPYFPVLYTGENGRVAHECILDLRPLKERTGISVDDVAKRLIDFGFHAPTMSFPVPGTLMIEPTESEPREELDRFCDAMIAIRQEMEDVATGALLASDNPLVNAPHTAHEIAGEWNHSYSRQQATYPSQPVGNKYWPPVARVDNVYGDRHLFCSCPPIAETP